jgi:predicted nucleic acid-binding protein
MLLDELERALGYAKLRSHVSFDERRELLESVTRGTTTVQDPEPAPAVRSPDPDDDYLIALASISHSVLVSGDSDLLGLSGQIPVRSPAEFLGMIEVPDPNST